ncbi:MAG: hypothetical protein LBQ22_04415 [Bacteroidales bacterium]|nr:hypothetical protein [Bacteroidales bacterium]
MVSCKGIAVQPLINELGQIGKNQYKSIPQKPFLKKSYPLPRDIAARTLAGIGQPAFMPLVNILDDDNKIRLSEAIDALGHICFYNKNFNIFPELRKCFDDNINNGLICWKLIRAMSGIPESSEFLKELSENSDINALLKPEIKRSLGFM